MANSISSLNKYKTYEQRNTNNIYKLLPYLILGSSRVYWNVMHPRLHFVVEELGPLIADVKHKGATEKQVLETE
jgi:hypothetical protein